jgi:membrane-bound lytic murein transglycosylase B
VLAAIGTVESDNGQSKAAGVQSGQSPSGAEGPMQFEPGTFAAYAVWADRSRKLSPYDAEDAIFTAARMLCADGAAGGSAAGIKRAILAYNHSAAYVSDVQAIAARYTTAARVAAKPAS